MKDKLYVYHKSAFSGDYNLKSQKRVLDKLINGYVGKKQGPRTSRAVIREHKYIVRYLEEIIPQDNGEQLDPVTNFSVE